MSLATNLNLSFNSFRVGDLARSSLIMSSVGRDLTSVSSALVCKPRWGAPKNIIAHTGRVELYPRTEPLTSLSA